MKRIVYINIGNFGSTGMIVNGISENAKLNGFDVLKCYPELPINSPKADDDYIISSNIVRKINNLLGFVTGYSGLFSFFTTRKLINRISSFNPDIIHLHNIHSSFLNFPMLFRYIAKNNIKLVWTLHDCWAFTGRCPYFTMVGCDKWKCGCCKCEYPKLNYPRTLIDKSKKMWILKKNIFTSIRNVTIVTPSHWLEMLIKESFLNVLPVVTINNGIDTHVFKPTKNDFREKYNIENKFVVLGVAFGWGPRKGLDVFIELSRRLNDRYQIVLVGTDKDIDSILPKNIISIHRTNSRKELAGIYTASDVFVNPTREDNYPTVNMEAISCGTPVITFNTGGSPEIIDNTCGVVVDPNDIDSIVTEIKGICLSKKYSEEACLKRAKSFNMNDKYQEYIDLYLKIHS